MHEIKLVNAKAHPISDHLYGIFLEDIGFSVDGGLNANLINNYSFDGVYLDKETFGAVSDPLRYWDAGCASFTSEGADGVDKNSLYARVSIAGKGSLTNYGYHGGQHGIRPAMSILPGQNYVFSCWLRNIDFAGTVSVQILAEDGTPITTVGEIAYENMQWQRVSAELTGSSEAYGKLVITFCGSGSLDLDCLCFRSTDVWHPEDPKWRHGKLRRDLVEALQALQPSFMRFPGGCIVEGMRAGNEYNWKDTVGELWERKSNYSLWGEAIPDGGYNQSYQIGFYEYFCLCEDLEMIPLPTLSAGINCQIRAFQHKIKDENVPVDSQRFREYIIRNYLDLIAFANGDPAKNKWAALRSRMGHPEPFGLKYIGIGNENFGKDYLKRFDAIAEAIHAVYPEIRCVMSAGFLPHKFHIAGIWKHARKHHPNALVDEHSYHLPSWFVKQANRYDRYPRGTAKVYMGEYSANGLFGGKKMTTENSNQFDSALAEAAFMTGMERNGDVVEMSSYAPLLNLVECEQWYSNLIDFNPRTVCPSVNYWNQLLFRKYYAPEAVPFRGKLPKGVYLSVTQNSDALFMKLVNTTNQQFVISVSDIQTSAKKAHGEILHHSSPETKNQIDFHGAANNLLVPVPCEMPVENGVLTITSDSYSIMALRLSRSR